MPPTRIIRSRWAETKLILKIRGKNFLEPVNSTYEGGGRIAGAPCKEAQFVADPLSVCQREK